MAIDVNAWAASLGDAAAYTLGPKFVQQYGRLPTSIAEWNAFKASNGGGGGGSAGGGAGGAFDYSGWLAAQSDTAQQQFDWLKSQFGQTIAEQIRQFNITHGLQQANLAEQIRQFDIVNRTNYATSMAEQIRQFDATHQLAQQGQKQNLAMGLLSGASALRGPADWLSYANYTSGGKNIFEQLYGDQAAPAFGAPTGYSQPANVSDILKQLGVNLSPQQPGVPGNPGPGGAAGGSANYASELKAGYEALTKRLGRAPETNSPEMLNLYTTITGLSPELALQAIQNAAGYYRSTGMGLPDDKQNAYIASLMGGQASAPVRGIGAGGGYASELKAGYEALTKRLGRAPETNSPEMLNLYTTITGLSPELALQAIQNAAGYYRSTGMGLPDDRQNAYIASLMGGQAPAQGQMQALPVGQASPVASALQQATAPITGPPLAQSGQLAPPGTKFIDQMGPQQPGGMISPGALQSGPIPGASAIMGPNANWSMGPRQPGGVSQTGTDVMAPLPYQINPAVWDSLSSTAKQMILAAAGAGRTPSGAWDETDYLNQFNASLPMGTAPKSTNTTGARHRDIGREGTRMPDCERVLLLSVRQALIIVLGAIETYLGMERSIVPKHKREAG